ncbi:hypothetical protein MNAN1_001241 [Malassezia nana]|uniref:Tubulin binding cofactor C-like domain-containing protein n=1 Tax=Malassezia nana TaxID=180528 RepID=A0AAF0EKD2_9BASI|nr:hypothetical protein MNAN1_001241 [Malassezia nana]
MDVSAAQAQAFFEHFPSRLDGACALLTLAIRAHVQQGEHERAVTALLEARQALQTHAHVLPAYDRQKYEAALADVQRTLHKAQPAAPFHFARSAPSVSAASAPAAPRPRATAPALPPSDTTVADKHDEVVRLAPISRAVHLHRLHACVVHLGDVQGSVLVDACTYCILLGTAWQCRVSHSHHLALGMDTRSPITLDASEAIRVSAAGAWHSEPDAPAPPVQDMDDAFGTGAHWAPLAPSAVAALRDILSDPPALRTHLAT